MLAHVCNGQKPSCSHFFSMALQQSYRECAGHIRDIVLFIRDVGLSPVVPNEHARLVFQHATCLHNVLELNQPTMVRVEILSLAGMAQLAFTCTMKPSQHGLALLQMLVIKGYKKQAGNICKQRL